MTACLSFWTLQARTFQSLIVKANARALREFLGELDEEETTAIMRMVRQRANCPLETGASCETL